MKGNLVFVFDFDQTLAITDVEKGRDSQWLDLRGFIRFNEKMMNFLQDVRVHHEVYLFTTRHPLVLDRIYEILERLIPRENMFGRRFCLDEKSTAEAMKPENAKAFIEKVRSDKYQRLFQLTVLSGDTIIAFDDEYDKILEIAEKEGKIQKNIFVIPPIEE